MSLLFAPPESDPELSARLHLFGVLPAFTDLLEHSPAARQTLGESRFSLRLQSGKLHTDLVFSEGRCRVLRNATAKATVCLRFLSHTQLNHQFTGDGFSLPIPVRGARHIRILQKFSRLSEQLKNALSPPCDADESEHDLHVRLTLIVALAAAGELIAREPFSRSLFADKTDWAVQFTIGGIHAPAWVGCKDGRPAWGRGIAQSPLATLQFRDTKVARKALGGTPDHLALVNSGDIMICGFTPLVDELSAVLERLPVYLKFPSSP